LGEKDGRAEIDVEMGLPAGRIEGGDVVPLEACGVVDEAGWDAEPLGATRDQRLWRALGLDRLECQGFAAEGLSEW
jgi:hypothetical protein